MSVKNKVNQSRWWIIWGRSGALSVATRARDMDSEKAEAMESYRQRLRHSGNLTNEEVDRLVNFEFIWVPESIKAQVYHYYLLIKVSSPKLAENMLIGSKRLVKKLNQDGIKELCIHLHNYIPGFLIRFNGQCYTVSSPVGFRKV